MKDETYHTTRLYIESKLVAGGLINVKPEQAHYLKNVMRLRPGNDLRLFNGRDGEWRGELTGGKTKDLGVKPVEQLKPQTGTPDAWLCCAPIKKAHFDTMIEKATELGVSAIQPILTNRTQVREVNTERCRAIAIEAAEQSERMTIPEIRAPLALSKLAAGWPKERALIVCAEFGVATPVKDAFALRRLKSPAPIAIVTGPEGGFSEEELAMFRKVEDAVFIRLGPRILRADTAAIAALSCWQAMCGDWPSC